MLILITYDVSTETKEGKARLRKIAKLCVDYGQRVQNSVFECELDQSQCFLLKKKILKTYNEKEDSIRFYTLGNNYKNKVEHYGIKETYMPDSTMIF